MEDYLRELPVKGAWREGGIQYVDKDEERRASALSSSSGLVVRRSHMVHFVVEADIDVGSELAQNYAFGIPYLDVPSKAQPHDQLRAEVTNTNYNNPRIFLHIFIHLDSYYLVILRFLLSVFGLANRA
jgi:hypothetical protein